MIEKFKILDPDFAIIQENVRRWTEKDTTTFYGFDSFHFYLILEKMNVDIQFFSLKNINGKKYWVGEDAVYHNKTPDQKYHVRFAPNDLLELDTIKLYGLKFYSPKNPEKYLDMYFGKNWKTQDKKQFIWKNKMESKTA